MIRGVSDSTEGTAGAGAAADGSAPDHSGLAAPTDDEVPEFPDQECRLLVMGMKGNGKSHTADTILGLHHDPSFYSSTVSCQRRSALRFGLRLEVIDTPDMLAMLRNTQVIGTPDMLATLLNAMPLNLETLTTEVARCFGIIAPGPHAIVIVHHIEAVNREQDIHTQVMGKLDEIFGPQLIRYVVVVFTHGDQLDRREDEDDEAAVKRKLEDLPDTLKKFAQLIDNRYVLFDNTASEDVKAKQVEKLMGTISRMLAMNGKRPYDTNLIAQAERVMQKRERQLKGELQRQGRDCGAVTSSGRCINLELRDIARGEVVQDKSGSLLEEIKAKIGPIIVEALLTRAIKQFLPAP